MKAKFLILNALFCGFLSLSPWALYAQFLNLPDTPASQNPFLGRLALPHIPDATDPERSKQAYIPPNERHPIRSKKLLDQAPLGIYVAVGTERGFIGTALNDHASHLLLVDSDPAVIRYDRINAALLGIANSVEHYRHLRFKASHNEWTEQSLATPNVPYSYELRTESNWQFWQTWMKNSKSQQFHRPPHENAHEEFKDANYLYDDAQFQKLSQMAREGHIQAESLDLKDPVAMGAIVSAIKASGLKMSVMDLSNIWEIPYLQPSQLTTVTRQFQDVTRPDTIVLFTARSCEKQDLEDNRPELFTQESWTTVVRWIYFGYTFDYFSSKADDELQRVFSEIPNFEAHRDPYPLQDTLNGRPIWAKDFPYYNIYDLEAFPALEREKLLKAVIDAHSFEEALQISGATVDVFIADEVEARKYGEKYVLPLNIRQLLNRDFHGWEDQPAAFFDISPTAKFIVMIDPSFLHHFILGHEVAHRLLAIDTSKIPLPIESNVRQKDLRTRLNILASALEEFSIFQLERQNLNLNELVNGHPFSQDREYPNLDAFKDLAQSLKELRSVNNFTSQQTLELLERLLQTQKTRLPNLIGNPNPVLYSIETIEAQARTLHWYSPTEAELYFALDRLKDEVRPLYPESKISGPLYPNIILSLMDHLEMTKDVKTALKAFETISKALEQADTLSQKEKETLLIRQIKFLNTKPGRDVLHHILESPPQMLVSGAQFGAALFFKHVFQYIFGTHRSNLENFIDHIPQSLLDYLIFSVGSAIGRGSYEMGVELPFQFYRKLIYKKLILASTQTRGSISENFGKSEINYLRRYRLYKPFFMNQAALIGGLIGQQLWETGDIDGKALFRSLVSLWAAEALVTFTVEKGVEFAVLKWSGRVWKLKNMAGPWGWAALAMEWGLVFFGAEEIEKTSMYLYQRTVAISNLKEKWAKLTEKVMDPQRDLAFIKTFYDQEFHPAFAKFRIFLMQDIFLANQNYMHAFEDLRKKYDLIYQTSLKIKEAERSLELANVFNWPDPDQVTEEQILLYSSQLGMLKQKLCFLENDYNPDTAILSVARQAREDAPSCSAAFNRGSMTIQEPIQWKENYERMVGEFHEHHETKLALEAAAQTEREENFNHPMIQSFFSSREEDFKYFMSQKGEYAQDPDIIQALPTTNLLQEKAIVDALMAQASNEEIRSFLKQKSFSLGLELLNLVQFLKDPFDLKLSPEEENELEDEYESLASGEILRTSRSE